MNNYRGPGTDEDAVSTYNLVSWGPEPPGDPQEGVTRAILLSGPYIRRRMTDAGGPEHPIQFTNRRMRIFITTPSARNVNNTEDPP